MERILTGGIAAVGSLAGVLIASDRLVDVLIPLASVLAAAVVLRLRSAGRGLDA